MKLTILLIVCSMLLSALAALSVLSHRCPVPAFTFDEPTHGLYRDSADTGLYRDSADTLWDTRTGAMVDGTWVDWPIPLSPRAKKEE